MKCFGNGTAAHHAKGCRPGRPLCRWMRAMTEKYSVCLCPVYPWPHRRGSRLCGKAGRERMNELVWGRGERGDDDAREGLEDGGPQPAVPNL